MLTVACIYKEGDGFTNEYVRRLRTNVATHCHVPHKFVVVTPTRVLPTAVRGFWIKLELFKKGRFDGPVVYLDLDTIIIDDVTDIFTHPHEFTMGTDWGQPPGPNSTFMAWDGTQDLSHLDITVDPQIAKAYPRGDQAYIFEKVGIPVTWLDTLSPQALASYKFHVKGRDAPIETKIVAFHGSPRPHEIDWRL